MKPNPGLISFATVILLLFLSINASASGSEVSNIISRNNNVKQAELLTIGFSGILWKYIRSGNLSLLNVSDQCLQGFNHISKSVQEGKPEAFEFIGASGHLPNKFLKGSFPDFGQYEKCMEFSTPFNSGLGIQSHYCLASVLPDSNATGTIFPHPFNSEYDAVIKIGFCLPFKCNHHEVKRILEEALSRYSWQLFKLDGCEVRSSFTEKFHEAGQFEKGCILFLGLIIMLAVFSSLVEIYTKWSDSQLIWYGNHWLKHFSLQNTRRNLLNAEEETRLNYLDKIRIFIVCIVLTVHAIFMAPMGRMMSLIESTNTLKALAGNLYFQPLNNDWIFDGLIYFGGMMTAMSLWRKMDEKTRYSSYLKVIAKRFLMYWPILLICIALQISLPLLGSGPSYLPLTRHHSQACQQNFWYTLFHIQNYLQPYDMCLPHTWSMAAELHLYLLGCTLVYLYKTRPRLGFTVNIITTVFGLLWTCWLFYRGNVIPRIMGPELDWSGMVQRFSSTYFSTESHLFTYSFSILVFYCESRFKLVTKLLQGTLIKVLILLVILQAYSPALWNVYRFQGSPVKYGLHAVAYKSICAVFFVWITQKFNMKYPSIGSQSSKSIPVDEAKTDVNQNELINTKPPNEKFSPTLKVVSAAARSAYFVHYIYFVWYYSKKSAVYPDLRLITDTIYLVSTSFLVGLAFHFFVMGPFESILHSKKTSNKLHSN